MSNVRLCVVVAVCSLAACSKKTPDTFTTACVVSRANGSTLQCFEQTSSIPRAERDTQCHALETLAGGKLELRTGTCPTEGCVGVCDKGEGNKSACYDDRERCAANCAKDTGKFTPN